MAGRTTRLSPWLVLAVLLAHGLVLQGAAERLQPPSALRTMADPMFTRVLQPQTAIVAQHQPVVASQAKVRNRSTGAKPPAASKPQAKPADETVTAQQAPEKQAQDAKDAQAAANAAAQPPIDAASAASAASAAPAASAASAASATAATAAASAASAALPASAASATAADAQVPQSTNPSAQKDGVGVTDNGPSAPALDSWPRDTRLNYRMRGQFRGGELYGKAHVQWQREGTAYQVQVGIDVALLLHQLLTSQGEVTPQGLAPHAYEETRPGKRRAVRLEGNTVLFENGQTAPRPENVQDTASQFVELSHRFSSGREPLQVGRSVSFWMARPSGLDLWTYDIVEHQVLQTPNLGAIDTYRLQPQRVNNPHGNISAEIWYAPSLQYLPVRIRLTVGESDYVDLLVDSIEQR